MLETLRKVAYFGLGAAVLTADKVKQLVDDLVSRGDITREEGRKLYEDLTSRAEEQGRALNERIRVQVRDMLHDLGVADRSQITALENRIAALETRVKVLNASLIESETLEG
jgi:polyhydroxyalkanoate synthesis regulator phasin